jgi:prevent-host-death family protein
MRSWQLQDAKARFSEFLDAALKNGPQMVTRRGVEAAVLVPIEEWKRLQAQGRRNIKDLLLSDGSRFDDLAPGRGSSRRREPIDFSGPDFNGPDFK